QIAQALAAAQPRRIEGLVLCDTAPRIGEAAMWKHRIDGVRETGLAAMSEAVLERWFTQKFREERPDELALWRAMLVRTPAESYTALCAALRDADLSASTARIAKPTLCLVGDEDGSTPPALVRAMAETIAGARFEIISGAGHLPCVEAPEQLASLIVDFMKEAQLA
ncbi:MAG: alpha/beta fold hydrolase, partial [Rhodovibrionaceae bacterium]